MSDRAARLMAYDRWAMSALSDLYTVSREQLDADEGADEIQCPVIARTMR